VRCFCGFIAIFWVFIWFNASTANALNWHTAKNHCGIFEMKMEMVYFIVLINYYKSNNVYIVTLYKILNNVTDCTLLDPRNKYELRNR
jgi:hypothetical protein